MKLTAFLLLAPAILAAALPIASPNDVLSEIESREASPEADPVYYIKRTGYGDHEKREASPEVDPVYYIKRAGYGGPVKREAEIEF
jgi:hypothetical protein